jgi:hypothetical protein
VGNTPKPMPAKNRKAKIEQLRREQRATERRKTIGMVAIAVSIGLLLVSFPVYSAVQKYRNDPKRQAVTAFGVPAAAAGCDAPTNDKTAGVQSHIGPGSDKPNQTTVNYTTVPPSSGPHLAFPAPFGRSFYTTRDRPGLETLVHNLEHGYTVIWYDDTITAGSSQYKALQGLAERIPVDAATAKVIVSAWDSTRGAFPSGKHIAMSHWGATTGHRQLCGQASGQVIADFLRKFPTTDAPEPRGA